MRARRAGNPERARRSPPDERMRPARRGPGAVGQRSLLPYCARSPAPRSGDMPKPRSSKAVSINSTSTNRTMADGTTERGDLDLLCINTIRTLSMDAVQKANSGHPGTPMALAPLAYVLWTRHLRHNPHDPEWFGR